MTTAINPDPPGTPGTDPAEIRTSGRTFDQAKIEVLEEELQSLGVTLPDSPDTPEFEQIVMELGATHPDLSRRLSAAVVDELSAETRARFSAASKRGDFRNRLARNATGAVRTTNHKGRQQINPTVVKGAGAVVVLAFAAWFVFFADTGQPAAKASTGDSAAAAEEVATSSTEGGEVSAGPPTPASADGAGRTIPAARTGPALNPDGTPNTGATGTSTEPGVTPAVTPVQVNNATPAVPTDQDNGSAAPSYTTPDPVVMPVATTPQPVAVRSAPTPTPADIAALQAMYGDGAPAARASGSSAPAAAPRPVAVTPTTVTVSPARSGSSLQVVSAPADARGAGTPAAPAGVPRAAAEGASSRLVSVSSAPAPATGTPPARATLVTQSTPAATPPAPTARPGLNSTSAPARAPEPAAPEVTYRTGLVAQTAAAAPSATTGTAAAANAGLYGGAATRASGAGTPSSSAPAGLQGTAVPGATTRAPALPYRMGDLVDGQLLTGIAFIQPIQGQASMASQQSATAQKLTVYAQTADGSRWRGEARTAGGGRVAITFDRVLIGTTEYPIQAEAVGSDRARLPGLQANVRREAPDAANSILQALASGIKTFAQQSAQGTTTAMPNGTVVTNNPKPNFWVTLGGSVAAAYSPGTPSITQVDLVYLDAAAPLGIAVRGTGTP